MEIDGQASASSGSVGVELNYGAAKDLQLTVGLPISFSHDAGRWHWGAGDIKVAAKYRLINDSKSGVQLAVFPAMSIPTAQRGLGAGRVTGLLPVWVQKDCGKWSIFGGGGYAINPGRGMRDYWTGGIALSRQVDDRLLLGMEFDRHGPDAVDAGATTGLGAGAIYRITGPLRFLASAGPSFEDGGTKGYHAYVALGLDY